ncbi:MAG: hypothetical protein JWM99_4002, partial [Verrucomicrobiales bacterium]|nr:hypothetical protein [Verrucomicrobiales bacterium]
NPSLGIKLTLNVLKGQVVFACTRYVRWRMNFISRLIACALLLGGCLQSLGFNYNDQDLLLVFRKDGFNDIEFNLGSVNSIVNHPQGTDTPVINWDLTKVKALYDLGDDVRFLLVACTSKDVPNRIAWLSCAEDSVTPLDRTASQWQGIWSKIDGIGSVAERFTATNDVAYYSASSTDLSSYTFTASNGGTAPTLVPKLGGASSFIIEGTIPATIRFFQIKPSSATPKPAATLVGSFTMTADGTLVFHSGGGAQPPIPIPTISELTRSGETIIVKFDTVSGVSYRLRHTNVNGLSTVVSSWSAGTDSVNGTGQQAQLSDSGAETAGFYVVEAFR